MRKFWTLLGIFAIVALLASPAAADTLTYYFDTPFDSKPLADGSPPWLTAVFDDQGTPGTVVMTLTANLVDDNFISGLYFNLDSAITLSSFTYLTVQSAPAPSINWPGFDTYKADGDGYYDLLFAFPTAGADRFDGADTWVVTIAGADLVASSFNLPSVDGKDNWYAAAHVQSISAPEGSTWIAGTYGGTEVPVPGAVWLLGSGLIGLVGLRRKFK